MIFINYRTDDVPDFVGRLTDALRKEFGPEKVFRDDERNLLPGDVWPDVLREKVLACQVVLAVIGSEWVDVKDERTKKRRIDLPDDWVVKELALAFEHKKTVITVYATEPPVRLTEAHFLADSPIRQLGGIQAIDFRRKQFESDLAGLVGLLRSKLRPSSAPPEVPHRPVVFHGRDADLADLVRRIAPDGTDAVRAVPVVGLGGIGKSTLARAAMWEPAAVARYGARRHFVRLDGATSRADVLREIAKAVGVSYGSDDAPDRLLEALATGGPRLLVLDNAESPLQVSDATDTEELLQSLALRPPLTVVATSRIARAIPGWSEPVEVRPLAAPAIRDTFLTHGGSKFAKDAGLSEFLGELDGWPLVAVMLGRQAPAFGSLKELRAVWGRHRAALLVRDAARRDVNIKASIDLSLGSPNLNDDSRRLLGLLGRLPDGVASDDLENLLPGVGYVAASDVRWAGGLTFDEALRLRVLAPIREHLAEVCHPPAADLDRAVRYYCGLAAGLDIGRQDNREKAARVTAEAGNVAAAIRIGLRTDDPEPAFAAVIALTEHSRFARVFHQASGIDLPTLVEQSLAVAKRRSDSIREADLLRAQGDIAFDRWANDTATKCYESARAIYERLDVTEGVALCIHGFGEIACRSAERKASREAARMHLQEGLALARRCGSALVEGRCLVGLAELFRHTAAEDGSSRVWFDEARTAFQNVSDLFGVARCVHGLGDLTMTLSETARKKGKTEEAARHLDEALRYYQEALPLFEAMGGTLGLAATYRMFGIVAKRRGEHGTAEPLFREALTRFREVESIRGQVNCLNDLGLLALKRDDLDAALLLYSESALLATKHMSETWEAGVALRGLGEVSQSRNQLEDARKAFTQAVKAFTDLNDTEQVSFCNERLSQIQQLLGRASAAPTNS